MSPSRQVTQVLCEHVAKRVVNQAREHGIAVPDDVFQPEDRDGESGRLKKRLTDEKMKELWEQASHSSWTASARSCQERGIPRGHSGKLTPTLARYRTPLLRAVSTPSRENHPYRGPAARRSDAPPPPSEAECRVHPVDAPVHRPDARYESAVQRRTTEETNVRHRHHEGESVDRGDRVDR